MTNKKSKLEKLEQARKETAERNKRYLAIYTKEYNRRIAFVHERRKLILQLPFSCLQLLSLLIFTLFTRPFQCFRYLLSIFSRIKKYII